MVGNVTWHQTCQQAPPLSPPGSSGDTCGDTGTMSRWACMAQGLCRAWHILGPWGGNNAVPLHMPVMLECP